MPVDPQIGKVFVSEVTLGIGMLSTQGGLYTIPKTGAGEEEKTRYLCPKCDEPHGYPEQVYQCKEDASHGSFKAGELDRGKEVDGKIVKLDADAIKEATTSVLPEKELALQVHNRVDVETHTFPKGNAYVFIPSGKSPFGAMLVELVKKHREVCFIAKTNIHKKDHLMMLDVELNDQLVLREMMWPEDMKQFPVVQHDPVKQNLLAQAELLIEASIEPFDEDEYRKDSRARVQELVDEAAGAAQPKTKAAVKRAKKSDDDDFAAKLEAAIAARKAS